MWLTKSKDILWKLLKVIIKFYFKGMKNSTDVFNLSKVLKKKMETAGNLHLKNSNVNVPEWLAQPTGSNM